MTRTDVILALGFLILTKPQAAAAWDATAGAIAPHTDSATFSATSDEEDDELDNVHDGVDLPTETDDGWVVAISPVPVVLALVETEDEGGDGDTGPA